MACTVCQRDIRIAAKGLCGACYQRQQKRGTTEYAARRARSMCHIDSCGKPAVGHGMCEMHYRRFQRHGHTEQTRPDDWGAKGWGKKTRHPLYNSWAHMRRRRVLTPMAPEWENDFLQFAADVGERPTPKHKLFAADDGQPIGPANFIWKRSITEKIDGECPKTAAARRQKIYRRLRLEAYQDVDLKRRYGLTRLQLGDMVAAQNGVCAICGEEERSVIRGKKISLSIDHCHASGSVRALLCADCNLGLGKFRDNPAFLRAAADYLDRYALREPQD